MNAEEKPHTRREVAEAVAAALSADEPLEVIGHGTRRELGRPVAARRRLDMSAITGISLYEPEELVFTAAAGTPLADIEAALAEKGQMLAFEPPDFSRLLGGERGRGTLGGMAASGLSGPRRIRAGAVRDHVLGFAGVNGRAEIFKSGGRVMKNVTGFDLSKLMCGSWGTLTVLTELTFKVQPAPETTATLIFRSLDAARAVRLMTAAMRAPAEVSGAAHLPAGTDGEESLACIRLEGFAPSVAARADMLKGMLAEYGVPAMVEDAEARALWRDVRDVAPLAGDREAFVWRIVCPPAQGGEVAETLEEMIPGVRYFLDWAGGLIWAAVPPSDHAAAELVRGAVSGCGGHAMLFRAPGDVRRRLPVFHPQPEPLAEATARIRAAFDPRDVLNPGRMHPSEKREG